LKLEATHLRTMPLPMLSAQAWHRLDEFGLELANAQTSQHGATLRKLDAFLCKCVFGSEQFKDKVNSLYRVVEQRQSTRIKSHDASTRTRSKTMPD
jgi:hypothetical protein